MRLLLADQFTFLLPTVYAAFLTVSLSIPTPAEAQFVGDGLAVGN